MQIPLDLRIACDQILAAVPVRALTDAAQALSMRYRQPETTAVKFIQTEMDRFAYLGLRLPATYVAAWRVLRELQRRDQQLAPLSVLDLGAGSGAATWAALNVFESLTQCTLLEQDRALQVLGQRLTSAAEHPAWPNAVWQTADLRQVTAFNPSDLVIASYALSELPLAQAQQIASRGWQAAQNAFVVIEPGTTKGFATILAVRAALLAQGANLIAPCPQAGPCPLPAGNWCHFAARVERTAWQRRLKAAELNYEDEKYAYLIFTKAPAEPVTARILRHPRRAAGYAQLELCTTGGLQSVTVTKRDKEAWRRARKADWGDDWE